MCQSPGAATLSPENQTCLSRLLGIGPLPPKERAFFCNYLDNDGRDLLYSGHELGRAGKWNSYKATVGAAVTSRGRLATAQCEP